MAPTILVIFQLALIAALIASIVIWVIVVRNHLLSGPTASSVSTEKARGSHFNIDAIAESLLPSRGRERPSWGIAEVLMMFGIMIASASLLMRLGISNGWIDKPVAPVIEKVADVEPAPDVEPTPDVAAEPASEIEPTALADSTHNAEPALESASKSDEDKKPSNPLPSLAISSIAWLLALCTVVAWMHVVDQHACRNISFTTSWADLRLGGIAALMILPPVLLISAAANYFIPYHHPTLDALANLNSPGAIAILFVSTAIVAPLCEEMLFRVLLQGGMQGLADRQSNNTANDREHSTNSYRPQAYWPLLVASAIFAILHADHGAAPIPLFFLAVGLGFLYRQTGRIAAPVIVHMVLNSMTLIQAMLDK